MENAFQFCSRNYLQTNGTVMGTKIAVGFANRHYEPTETFQDTNFYSCHSPGVKRSFIKGETLCF